MASKLFYTFASDKMSRYIRKNSLISLWSMLLMVLCLMVSCNSDDDIEAPETKVPKVTFDNGTGVYLIKVKKSVTVAPIVTDAVNPKYRWVDEKGNIVGKELSHTFSFPVTGEFYFTFCVDADNGSVKEEIRIDVVDKLVPAIVLPKGMQTSVGNPIVIKPAVSGIDDETEYIWTLDGKEVGSESAFTFPADEEGLFALSLTVRNEDGQATAEMQIRVLPKPELTVSFTEQRMEVFRGRMICLAPVVEHASSETLSYKWTVDGRLQPDASGASFDYMPATAGESTITVTVTDGDISRSASIDVKCSGTTEDDNYRPVTASSEARKIKVYEVMPAPGQFVDQIAAITMEKACEEAENIINGTNYVSLGSFGGYIVVGFDHSVLNKEGEYDFAIQGNSLSTSSEPGIVWVMQDENGNGLPDDTWYELRGSEADKPETLYNYSVTYYKPSAPDMPVMWVDNKNNTGTITLNPYYPAWQTGSSYTLKGTRLKARTEHGSLWSNEPFDWGYVDNFGNDRLSNDDNYEAGPNYNYFKIENAMYPNRQPVKLKYVDFIKVQCGILSQAGTLGEVSTEVFGFWDYNLK